MKKSRSNLVGTTVFEFSYSIGQPVHVDHDDKLAFVVTGIMINPEAVTYKLSWFCDGRPHSEWFDEFRISAA